MIVTGTQRVSHLEQIGQNCCWLQSFQGILHNIWILRDDSDEILCMWLGEQREVSGCDFFGGEGRSAGDGAESGVCVLEVRSGVAFEGCHGVHVEIWVMLVSVLV